jgi:hypothetical protein
MNFDKTNVHDEDNDYGHFCVLEENTHANNYVQRVYIQNNRYITLHNYDKPSLYPADYYYDNSIRVTMPGKIKFEKENTQKKYYHNNHNNHKNDDRDDDDDNDKGINKKIFIILTHMCVFSIFVSTAVVIIMTMR